MPVKRWLPFLAATLALVACRKAPTAARSDDAALASSVDAADAAEVDGLAQQVAELEALAAFDAAPGDGAADAVTDGGEAGVPAIVADLSALEGRVPVGARAVVEAARHRLRRCMKAGDAGASPVELTLVVKEGGEISKVVLAADAGVGADGACLAAALEALTFESPEGGFARLRLRLRLG